MTKDQLLNMLSRGVTVVDFTKKDGEARTMLATRDPEEIKLFAGEDYLPKGTGRPEPDHIVRAFDMRKNAWRSITIANITAINGKDI